MLDRQEHVAIKAGSERSFAWVFAVVFALVGFWPWIFADAEPRTWEMIRYLWLIPSVALLLLAYTWSKALYWPNFLWTKLGMLLGMVVAPIVISVIYFLVVTPTGLWMRLVGKDSLQLKKPEPADSYWILRENDAGTMKEQF